MPGVSRASLKTWAGLTAKDNTVRFPGFAEDRMLAAA